MRTQPTSLSSDDAKSARRRKYGVLPACVWILLFTSSLTAEAQQVVGYWKFDEGSGNIAHDTSGKENHGEIVNAQWTDGASGKALAFQDYSTGEPRHQPPPQYVRVKHNASLEPKTKFDVSATINIDPQFTPRFAAAIVQKGSGYGCSYRLLLEPDFNIKVAAGKEHVLLESSRALEKGKWIKVRATYDGRALKIFIDDKEAASQEVAIRDFSSADDVTFGERFSGKIDEVKITVE
jgi:hypothetical protein